MSCLHTNSYMSCLHSNSYTVCHVSILTLIFHVSILTLIYHVSIQTLILSLSVFYLLKFSSPEAVSPNQYGGVLVSQFMKVIFCVPQRKLKVPAYPPICSNISANIFRLPLPLPSLLFTIALSGGLLPSFRSIALFIG